LYWIEFCAAICFAAQNLKTEKMDVFSFLDKFISKYSEICMVGNEEKFKTEVCVSMSNNFHQQPFNIAVFSSFLCFIYFVTTRKFGVKVGPSYGKLLYLNMVFNNFYKEVEYEYKNKSEECKLCLVDLILRSSYLSISILCYIETNKNKNNMRVPSVCCTSLFVSFVSASVAEIPEGVNLKIGEYNLTQKSNLACLCGISEETIRNVIKFVFDDSIEDQNIENKHEFFKRLPEWVDIDAVLPSPKLKLGTMMVKEEGFQTEKNLENKKKIKRKRDFLKNSLPQNNNKKLNKDKGKSNKIVKKIKNGTFLFKNKLSKPSYPSPINQNVNTMNAVMYASPINQNVNTINTVNRNMYPSPINQNVSTYINPINQNISTYVNSINQKISTRNTINQNMYVGPINQSVNTINSVNQNIYASPINQNSTMNTVNQSIDPVNQNKVNFVNQNKINFVNQNNVVNFPCPFFPSDFCNIIDDVKNNKQIELEIDYHLNIDVQNDDVVLYLK
jgi:hypothetical protein